MRHDGGCPTCKGPRSPHPDNPSFPFCGPRCKLADLARWLDGRYTIAGEPVSDEDAQLADALRRSN